MAVNIYSLAADGETSLSTNFKVKEFKCKDGSDTILIDEDLVTYLQQIRDWAGASVIINSAYRTVSHNTAVGGASKSKHLLGIAADIKVSGKTPLDVARKAGNLGVNGIIQYLTFVHVDARSSKRWVEKLTSDFVKVTTFN